MPGGDTTGPMGTGPGTGWGRGGCVPAGRGLGRVAGIGGGMGLGRGMGWRRGFGFNRFFGAPSADEELSYLKEERDALNERVAELEKLIKEKK